MRQLVGSWKGLLAGGDRARALHRTTALLLAAAAFGGVAQLRADPIISVVGADDVEAVGEGKQGFQWKSALVQSAFFITIKHSWRLYNEADTRAEWGGPFFKDWWSSIKGIKGWRDGDPFLYNYIGHPMEGAVAGYIQVHNDPRYIATEFNEAGYWRSRFRALGYSALHSTLFEIGPASEASIGNVGKIPGENGAVDFVITPIAGMGWMVGEDVIDRYLIRRLERSSNNRIALALYRSFLNPSRSFANMMRFRRPWLRDRPREPGPPRR